MAKAKARKRVKASSKSPSSDVVLPVADVKSPDDVLLKILSYVDVRQFPHTCAAR